MKYQRAERKKQKTICFNCKKEFEKETYEISRGVDNNQVDLCSRKCNGFHASKVRFGKSAGFGFYVSIAKKRAVKKQFGFDLDALFLYELFEKQKGLCAISGIKMIFKTRDRTMESKSPYYASLDRIDSSIGYLKNNVQFVCLSMNYMRNTFTVEQTKKFIQDLKS